MELFHNQHSYQVFLPTIVSCIALFSDYIDSDIIMAYSRDHGMVFPEVGGRITFVESNPETCGTTKSGLSIKLFILTFMTILPILPI